MAGNVPSPNDKNRSGRGTVRLVLCMWLTDTELAAKLIRAAYSKA